MTLPNGSQSFAVIIDMLLKGDAEAKEKLEAIEKEAINAKKTLADFSTSQLEQIKKLAEAEEQRAKNFARNNQLIISELKAQASEISKTAALLRSQAGDIDRFAKPLQTGGALIVGGIFAAANKYVNDAKVATATTIEWKRAQDSLNQSGQKIGEVLAREALPLLKEAAQVTAQIARFLQANPEIVGVALKGGLLALTLGTIGKAVSSGIRLYADLKMDAALALQFEAAQLQLAAAKTQLQAAGIKASPTAQGGGLGAGPLAAIGVGAAAFAGIGRSASNFGADLFGTTPVQFWRDMLDQEKKTIAIWAYDFGKLFGKGSEFFQAATGALGLRTSGPGSRGGQGGNTSNVRAATLTEQQIELAQLYEKYKQDDLAAVQQHYAERKGIISDALASERAATANFVKNVSRITTSINNAILKAGEDFAKENLRAEQEYNQSRADIIEQGNRDIEQLREDSQERLRKIEEDGEERKANARNRRDALGLRDAIRDTNRAARDERENTAKEIARRRQDTALRLRELDSQFAQERARRLEDYQARVAELEKQKKEQIAEAAAAHAEEINRIREESRAKLRQLDQAFVAEQEHRRDALIAQIRNVDAALIGEQNLRNRRYAEMLIDLDRFLLAAKAKIGSGGSTGGSPGSFDSTPTHDYTGYAPKGIYKMAQQGGREFVLSGADTRTMERIVGGQLTQANIVQAAMRGGVNGGSSQVVWNDSRKFDGRITAAERRVIQQDTEKTISKFLKNSLVGA